MTASASARSAAESTPGHLNDHRLYEELAKLARVIEAARRDIAALRPDEIRQKHLPTATDELDAIVGATADATGEILDAAEQISAIADAAGATKLTEQVTRIFEACSFQDITGQRITKVVKTLKEIEAKVVDLVRAFGSLENAAGDVDGSAAGQDGEAALLNGPQLPRDARSQADIDAIFDKS
jgi:chemotaxis protein CheZ